MSGTNIVEYNGRGINFRALDDLFEIKRNRSDEVRSGSFVGRVFVKCMILA